MRGRFTLPLIAVLLLAGSAGPQPAAPPAASPPPASGATAAPASEPPARPQPEPEANAPKPQPPTQSKTKPQEAGGDKVNDAMESICLILESAAAANGLPLEFFARVIWQESRFQPNAVGPVTRSGHRAQGIAQFMPYTADERGLIDPFNPVAALPKAAEFLRELRAEFGNVGLAAAAYNAGPGRVRGFLAGRGGMPAETRNYVRNITGRTVDEWASLGREGGKDAIAKPTSCRQLAALLKEKPSFFIGELERHVREGVLRPWGVQLNAGFARARVLAAYARIERQYRALLENRDPMIIRTVLRSRGTISFYQVRVGVDSRDEANKLCASLTAKGAACMVLRNSRGAQEALYPNGEPAGEVAKSGPAGPAAQGAPAAARARPRPGTASETR